LRGERVSGSAVTRACLYHRCSTLDQDPALARDELRAAARVRGMEFALEVEETGSGARNDRPGLRRVLDAARQGEVGAVLCWKLDRFGRSSFDLLANVQELERCGVAFEAVTQGLVIRPGGDAVSRLLLTMLAGVASFERDLIVERTRLGLAKARGKGKRLGRPRKGPIPDRAEVEVMRRDRLSWSTIARRLGCTSSAARRACQKGVVQPTP
jgi:DNA invertase Pin-like site-specific DNA recombinase